MRLEDLFIWFLDMFYVFLMEMNLNMGKQQATDKLSAQSFIEDIGIQHLYFLFFFFLCAKISLLSQVPSVPTTLQAAEQDFTGTHSSHHMSRFLSAVPNGLSIPSLTPNYPLIWQMLKLLFSNEKAIVFKTWNWGESQKKGHRTQSERRIKGERRQEKKAEEYACRQSKWGH